MIGHLAEGLVFRQRAELPIRLAVENPVEEKGPRWIKLRFPSTCVACSFALPKGTLALWDPQQKTVTCRGCAPAELKPLDDVAGASAAAEADRRAQKRIEAVRKKHGDPAAEVAEEMANRDMDATWRKGSDGESRLAAYIRRELGDLVIPLHDRIIPGTRGNIDHIFIAPTGIWVVDAKSYEGKVEKRERGPIWDRETLVYVNRRNRTSLVKAMGKQVDAVKIARGPLNVPIYAGLCFLDSEWGFMDSPFLVNNVWVGHAKSLRKELKRKGPLDRAAMERAETRLDLSLPRAN